MKLGIDLRDIQHMPATKTLGLHTYHQRLSPDKKSAEQAEYIIKLFERRI